MKNLLKNTLQKLKPILYPALVTIAIIISMPLIIWCGFKAYDLLFNADLRAKKSYSREITINFEYQGKDYVMKPVITCINNGAAINEGSIEWYTGWSYEVKNKTLELSDGKKTEVNFFYFCKHCLNGDLVERIFQTKIKGNASPLCDIILESDKKTIDEFIKASAKPNIFSKAEKDVSSDNNLSSFVMLTIIDSNDTQKENMNIKIKSYQIGDKKSLEKKY
jgi:hypothetical protein